MLRIFFVGLGPGLLEHIIKLYFQTGCQMKAHLFSDEGYSAVNLIEFHGQKGIIFFSRFELMIDKTP